MKKLLLLLSLMLILPGYHQTATIETVSGTTSAQVYPAWYLSLCQSAVKDDSLTQDEFLQAFPDAACERRFRARMRSCWLTTARRDSRSSMKRMRFGISFVWIVSRRKRNLNSMLRLVCLNATFAHILPLSPLRLTPSFPKMLSLCRRVFSSSAIRQRISRWRRSFGSATRNFFPTMAGC